MALDDMKISSIDVPEGFLPNVVTHLEMTAKPEIDRLSSSLKIVAWDNPEPEKYCNLFRKVGEPWLWLSRLLLDQEELVSIIQNDTTEIYLIQEGDRSVGYIELDFGVAGQCEIVFFGLIPEMNVKGHGRWLMAEALQRAWRPGIRRLWLHTCTLDSPRALGFYLTSGFTAYKREVDMLRDPRLTGHYPKDAAPQIPLL